MTSLYPLLLGLGYLALYFARFQSVNQVLWLGLGFAIGVGLMEFDELVGYKWYNEPNEKFLITRSPLFLLSYLPLAIFGLTSSGSILGSGLVLGIGTNIWVEMMQSYTQPEAFKKRFLSQVAVPVSSDTIKKIVAGSSLSLIFLASILLW